ncbi:MAG TPA: rhomboid family intramembrane serine protease [Steroidobacteraceae bacterium]|nr:rhomboid family intramembrane serine protease [Steroidobacteraceae bacterium]
MPVPLPEAIELHRSRRAAQCERYAFVLTAVGIANEITRDGAEYVLWVAPEQLQEARAHLASYHREQRPPPAPPPGPLHPWAWLGSLGYAACLLLVAAAVSAGWGRLDAFDAGSLDADLVRQGQWWRAVTALTLHLDLDHIVANLGAGIWFGYLAGRLLGPGLAWALVVLDASLANLVEGLLAPSSYESVGASTAVFAALGLMAAYSWRERHWLAQRWPRRFAPLVAGIVLLGWLGTAGAHTDVFAHLAGFATGALSGAVIGLPRLARLRRLPQWVGGAAALALLALAWTCALRS